MYARVRGGVRNWWNPLMVAEVWVSDVTVGGCRVIEMGRRVR